MTAKEKAIREAYGEYWEQVKDFVDENGWFEYDFYNQDKSQEYKTAIDLVCDNISTTSNPSNTHIRPKSLDGISDNNGWISVEDQSSLANEEHYFICNGNNVFSLAYFYISHDKKFSNGAISFPINEITHYQQVIKLKPPIY